VADKLIAEHGKTAVAVEEEGDRSSYEFALACGGALRAREVETIQVNVGLACNQSCRHCHVRASPTRTERMDPRVMREVIAAAERTRCSLVEITGGAPELHPEFRWFVSSLRQRRIPVRLRSNLTVLQQAGLEDVPELLRDLGVRLVASLPCYLEENVRAQRGKGTYEKSVEVIKRLNSLGYGVKPDLPLDLVYNPGGASLPPEQAELEETYHRELEERFGVRFTHLLTITNMPNGRFLDKLRAAGSGIEYMTLLRESFNPATIDNLMCRQQISVDWDGNVYDCDFNLALDLPILGCNRIESLDQATVVGRAIRTGDHCFGCTAGAGSSCGGALV
jgi:radical SAM/Cys-rich protein